MSRTVKPSDLTPMSNLQIALDYFGDTGGLPDDIVYSRPMLTVLDAATLVTDPNIEAATEAWSRLEGLGHTVESTIRAIVAAAHTPLGDTR